MPGWVIALVAVIAVVVALWIWRVRRSDHAQDAALGGYLIGDQIVGGPHHHDHGHSGWADGGGTDAGAGPV